MAAHTTSPISNLLTATPLEEAASEVLAHRLTAVRACLRKTTDTPSQLQDHVHALRVSTRRAAAAFDFYRDCLPKSIRREVRRMLRSLRKAAAAARDADVLLSQLAEALLTADSAEVPTLDMLTGYALAHRSQAQAALERAACNCRPRDLKKLQRRVRAAVRWKRPPQPAVARFAQPIISQRLHDVNRLADRTNTTWPRLHEVRIAGKRLRYTLEVVAGFLDPAIAKDATGLLVRLQDVLGGVNDHFTAAKLLAGILRSMQTTTPAAADRYQHVLEQQIAAHHAAMRKGREAFIGWLGEWHSATMQHSLASVCGSPA